MRGLGKVHGKQNKEGLRLWIKVQNARLAFSSGDTHFGNLLYTMGTLQLGLGLEDSISLENLHHREQVNMAVRWDPSWGCTGRLMWSVEETTWIPHKIVAECMGWMCQGSHTEILLPIMA